MNISEGAVYCISRPSTRWDASLSEMKTVLSLVILKVVVQGIQVVLHYLKLENLKIDTWKSIDRTLLKSFDINLLPHTIFCI